MEYETYKHNGPIFCPQCKGSLVPFLKDQCTCTPTSESKPDQESEIREDFEFATKHIDLSDRDKSFCFIGFKSGILLSPDFEMKAKNNMLNAHSEDLSNQLTILQAEIESSDIYIIDLENERQSLWDKERKSDLLIKELEQQIESMKCCGNCVSPKCNIKELIKNSNKCGNWKQKVIP